MGFALSTSWNALRCKSGRALIFEIEKLGFEEVELSFNLTRAMVSDIEKLVRKSQIKVVSLHNYCPIPPGLSRKKALPDCYSMSSLDETERRQALNYSKRTIDTAKRLKARAVVLHCGRVELEDKTRQLILLHSLGLKNSELFKRLRKHAVQERADKFRPYLAQALKSLEELSDHALRTKISLGIENRFYYREIPSLQEIGVILTKFKGAPVYYWHDAGHARIMENLGLERSDLDYLKLYGRHLLGMHLHDVSGCKDHKAPSQGELNFRTLKPYLKKDIIRVMEVHHPANAHDVVCGRKFLERQLDAAG